jgi:hypothetical protein
MSALSKPELVSILKMHKLNNKNNATELVASGSVSSFTKQNTIRLLQFFFAAKRIQKFLRSRWSCEYTCPLSLEPVVYPLFAFKPKGSTKFVYYNLEILSNYLVNTGNFRDPKTREEYSEAILMSIDREMAKNKLKISVTKLKSVFHASKNKKYYRKKKDFEDTLLIIDRCIDDAVSSLRSWIENDRNANSINISFMIFRSYFRRLCILSRDDALNCIKRTMCSINKSVKNESDVRANENRDHVISFLYQIQFEELGI